METFSSGVVVFSVRLTVPFVKVMMVSVPKYSWKAFCSGVWTAGGVSLSLWNSESVRKFMVFPSILGMVVKKDLLANMGICAFSASSFILVCIWSEESEAFVVD